MSKKKDFSDQAIIGQVLSRLDYLESLDNDLHNPQDEINRNNPEKLCEIALFMLLPDGHELTERLMPDTESDYVYGATDNRRLEIERAAALLIAALRKMPG